ncbi:hypothetical protein [Sphingomonas gei]|uniref:hypothetical protein n=1 Tax=Sphingomonas gei TaxID=1395960 RepID=UPI0014424CBE|nr:hypothetical protein [Sphingomonas gei]
MGVIVDEMTSEVAPAAASAPASVSGGASAGPARDMDMERLDQAMRRRQHRVERRWAD